MTNQLPDDISFERWVQYVFDHPVPERVSKEVEEAYRSEVFEIRMAMRESRDVQLTLPPEPDWKIWHLRSDRTDWNVEADPIRTVEYVTRLFTEIERYTAPYSDAQVNQGIDFLLFPFFSKHVVMLAHMAVPDSMCFACIESFNVVYRELFAKRCTPIIGTKRKRGDPKYNPLNDVCFMWWDIFPFRVSKRPTSPKAEKIHQGLLEVMVKALHLKSRACQESALHGLGHWYKAYASFVYEAITQFIDTHPNLYPPLYDYAIAARGGRML